jgi:hypothetical protein
MKQKPWTEEQLEKANRISAYYMSLNNYNDLDVKIFKFCYFKN